jgi:hypothetical protein
MHKWGQFEACVHDMDKRHTLDKCGVEDEKEHESARGRWKRTSVDIAIE